MQQYNHIFVVKINEVNMENLENRKMFIRGVGRLWFIIKRLAKNKLAEIWRKILQNTLMKKKEYYLIS